MAEKEKSPPDVSITEAPASNTSRFSDDEAPKAPRSHSPSKGRTPQGWDDWWVWEVIGVVMSAAAICAIIGLLARMNGHKLPDWGFKIKERKIGNKIIPEKTVNIALNSVISWISTVGKICILIPITKGIGQLKCKYLNFL